jgi:hypothetical protein
MTNETKIADLNEDLVKMKLQVAIIQKTIKLLGGEIEDNYCFCGMHNNLCDDLCYDYLDDCLKKIITQRDILTSLHNR